MLPDLIEAVQFYKSIGLDTVPYRLVPAAKLLQLNTLQTSLLLGRNTEGIVLHWRQAKPEGACTVKIDVVKTWWHHVLRCVADFMKSKDAAKETWQLHLAKRLLKRNEDVLHLPEGQIHLVFAPVC